MGQVVSQRKYTGRNTKREQVSTRETQTRLEILHPLGCDCCKLQFFFLEMGWWLTAGSQIPALFCCFQYFIEKFDVSSPHRCVIKLQYGCRRSAVLSVADCRPSNVNAVDATSHGYSSP